MSTKKRQCETPQGDTPSPKRHLPDQNDEEIKMRYSSLVKQTSSTSALPTAQPSGPGNSDASTAVAGTPTRDATTTVSLPLTRNNVSGTVFSPFISASTFYNAKMPSLPSSPAHNGAVKIDVYVNIVISGSNTTSPTTPTTTAATTAVASDKLLLGCLHHAPFRKRQPRHYHWHQQHQLSCQQQHQFRF
ncbi:uncharacterized protein K452DRAFT_309551 [Aplosporella prunicola CBS 121167]|uniref:Uncharacterized protein n=1 Tax=Aplosporella prunicola CBS 121167 TaxID=1176127 RepID=A0A6A6BF78_9PEZI|nr:uncharacterized protein K452DRAFT_309551 [Aplosporella prunicola CBS 121167]KAF2141121.1 hypothetical protein K452DRAFT_309551 [Aplosporella prunicola CBS 121167]